MESQFGMYSPLQFARYSSIHIRIPNAIYNETITINSFRMALCVVRASLFCWLTATENASSCLALPSILQIAESRRTENSEKSKQQKYAHGRTHIPHVPFWSMYIHSFRCTMILIMTSMWSFIVRSLTITLNATSSIYHLYIHYNSIVGMQIKWIQIHILAKTWTTDRLIIAIISMKTNPSKS